MASRGSKGGMGDRLRAVVTLVIVLAITTVVIALFIGAAADAGGEGTYRDDLVPSNDTVTLSGENVSDVVVRQSLNDSARLDGDASISGPSPTVDDSWTVSTWVRVENTTGDRLVVAQNGTRFLVYNGTSDEYACWRYDDAAGNTHRVAVNATSPGEFTNLQCDYGGGVLELRQNATAAVASVQTTNATATNQTLTTDNLNGSLEETRTFDAILTSGERDQLYNRPTAPLDAADRRQRVMYDAYGSGYGGSIPVYVQDTRLTASGVEKVEGLPGENPQAGTDYRVDDNTVALLAGGVLEGAPVVFVRWLASGSVVAIGGTVGSALRLAAILPLALLAKHILSVQLS